ncbi:hypothetical protein DIPPA_35603 [Diplonema papillatum]|nr:hypothetical protein DIPPA_35603 [Diplonema papillatum]
MTPVGLAASFEERLQRMATGMWKLWRELPTDHLLCQMANDDASAKHVENLVAERVARVIRLEQEASLRTSVQKVAVLESERDSLKENVKELQAEIERLSFDLGASREQQASQRSLLEVDKKYRDLERTISDKDHVIATLNVRLRDADESAADAAEQLNRVRSQPSQLGHFAPSYPPVLAQHFPSPSGTHYPTQYAAGASFLPNGVTAPRYDDTHDSAVRPQLMTHASGLVGGGSGLIDSRCFQSDLINQSSRLREYEALLTSARQAAAAAFHQVNRVHSQALAELSNSSLLEKLGDISAACIDASVRLFAGSPEESKQAVDARHAVQKLVDHLKELHKKLKLVVKRAVSEKRNTSSSSVSTEKSGLAIQRRESEHGLRALAGVSHDTTAAVSYWKTRCVGAEQALEDAKEAVKETRGEQRMAEIASKLVSDALTSAGYAEQRPANPAPARHASAPPPDHYILRTEHLQIVHDLESSLVLETRKYVDQREQAAKQEASARIREAEQTVDRLRSEANGLQTTKSELQAGLAGAKQKGELLESKLEAVKQKLDGEVEKRQVAEQAVGVLKAEITRLQGEQSFQQRYSPQLSHDDSFHRTTLQKGTTVENLERQLRDEREEKSAVSMIVMQCEGTLSDGIASLCLEIDSLKQATESKQQWSVKSLDDAIRALLSDGDVNQQGGGVLALDMMRSMSDDDSFGRQQSSKLQAAAVLLRRRVRMLLRVCSLLSQRLRQAEDRTSYTNRTRQADRAQKLFVARRRLLEAVSHIRVACTAAYSFAKRSQQDTSLLLERFSDQILKKAYQACSEHQDEAQRSLSHSSEATQRSLLEVQHAQLDNQRTLAHLSAVLTSLEPYVAIPPQLRSSLTGSGGEIEFQAALRSLEELYRRSLATSQQMMELQKAAVVQQDTLRHQQTDINESLRLKADLNERLERLQIELRTTTEAHEAAETKASTAHSELNEKTKRLQDVEREMEALSRQLEASERALDAAREENRQRGESGARRDIRLEHVEGELRAATEATDREKQLREAAEKALAAAQGEQRTLREQLLREEEERVQRTRPLERRVETLQSQLVRQQSKTDETVSLATAELHACVEERDGQIRLLEAELQRAADDKQVQVSRLSEAHEEHETDVARLRQQHKTCVARLHAEATLNEKLMSQLAEKEKEIAHLTHRLASGSTTVSPRHRLLPPPVT